MKAIRLCLVEDDRTTSEALVRLLQHAPDIACVGVFASTTEAERGIGALAPDVVLMDIHFPEHNGIEAVRRLKRAGADIQFVMLTTYDSSQLIFDALKAGAAGYLLKRSAPDELLQAIRDVHSGGSPMSMQIARKVVAYFHPSNRSRREIEVLTRREQEILGLLAKGLAYKQIADRLGISRSTVHGHLHVVYKKLHVQSGTEAIAKFLER